MQRYKVSDEQLIDAISKSRSRRQCMELLGMNTNGGGNYKTIKKRIENLKIDISHWSGMGWLKGKTHNMMNKRIRPLSECLIEHSLAQRGRLKVRLIKCGLLKLECYEPECPITTEWLDKSIVLHLDHINGIDDDNRIENLRLLCPNCHSQTSTYCGKNKKK